MGRNTAMIALDSNAMTYWIQAMRSIDGVPTKPYSDEKVAMARIFFWMPRESSFRYTPTVEAEYLAIKDSVKRDAHLTQVLYRMTRVNPLPDPPAVELRATELKPYHNGENDRRLVAECELAGILTLLTCDKDILRNLSTRARVDVCLPTTYWDRMAVPRGTRANQEPHPTNPLSRCTWWAW